MNIDIVLMRRGTIGLKTLKRTKVKGCYIELLLNFQDI